MTNLNQYHPFRDSVNKVAEGAPAVATDTKDDKDGEYRPWLSFKLKMRLVLGCISFVAIWFVVGAFFSENPELKGGFYSSLNKTGSKISEKIGAEPVNSVFDEHDLDDRGRNVSDAKSKAGFLSSLFCRGGKKASFCD